MAAESQQRQQFWVILIIVFLGFLGISMPYLIFPALFVNPAFSILPASWTESSRALFLGITLAAYPLGQFFGSPILGSLSDDYGRKHLISITLLISAFCNLLSGYAIADQQLTLLIVSRFLAGLMEGNIAIARAMAADLTLLSKHDTFGKINAVTASGYLIGPLLGGLLSDRNLSQHLTIATPFYCITILFFCLAGLSTLVLKKASSPPVQARSFWQRINLINRLKSLFSNKYLKFLMIISTSFTLAVDIFYEFAPVYLTIKWSLDPAQLVSYNAILCFALVIGNGWMPSFLSTRVSIRGSIISSIGSFALLLLGIVLTDSTIVMMLLFILCGLAIGVSTTLITVKISNAVPDAIQGEAMGVQMSLRVLGDAIICLFGGVLLFLSSKLILILAAILSALTMAYYLLRINKSF